MDEIMKRVDRDAELSAELTRAWRSGATAEDLAAVIAARGIEVETSQVERVLARIQEERGRAIGLQPLDDNELDAVAGGGSGKSCSQASDCDLRFKNPNKWDFERCHLWRYCDEMFEVPEEA